MRERILRDGLQQLRTLTIVRPFIMTVGEFHLDHAVDYRTLFSHTLQVLDYFVLLLLRQFLKLVERKIKMPYCLLLTSGFSKGVRLLIILQRLESVKLLHAAIASLQEIGEGVSNGLQRL